MIASLVVLLPSAWAVCPSTLDGTLTCATTITAQLDPGPWTGPNPGVLQCPVAGFSDLNSELGGVSCSGGCTSWSCQPPAYACGTPLPGVSQEGPEHVYAFTCQTSGMVQISLSGADCDLDLYVLDDACDPVGGCEAGRNNSHGVTESIAFACTPGTTHHVVVEGFGFTATAYTDYTFFIPGPGYCNSQAASPLGSYTLTFTPANDDVTGCVVGPDPCDLDEDGVFATGTCGGTDCDDSDPTTLPGATEIADGVDQDCDGLVDEGTERVDDDGDGFTELGGDCDDAVATRHPAALEGCDGVDEDCDGEVDEGTRCSDDDGDGWCEEGPCVGGLPDGDCHDGDPAQHPDAVEVQGNGIDDDCDGVIDGESPDTDGDGFTAAAGDCAPDDPAVHPGAVELDNDVDDDCDGSIDEGLPTTDDDGDGATELGGDCHDGDPAIGPAATELENGVDDDCDGTVDEGTDSGDDDGDGFTEAGGDCDDADDDIAPGVPEVANGIDDDCDGEVDEGLSDRDGDGYTDDDCDDSDGFANPGMEELCDGVDNDCDGDTDEGCDDPPDTDVPEPDAESCGCRTGSLGGAAWIGGIALLAVRRRRP